MYTNDLDQLMVIRIFQIPIVMYKETCGHECQCTQKHSYQYLTIHTCRISILSKSI